MPTLSIHDLLSIWWDWGSHGGIGATTGGLPLQENETALLIDSTVLKDLLINQI